MNSVMIIEIHKTAVKADEFSDDNRNYKTAVKEDTFSDDNRNSQNSS